jgi:RNA polymerase sigma-70 factor (ECF subfamily)
MELARAFVAACPSSAEDGATLQQLLQALVDEAQRASPDVTVAATTFAAHIAQHWGGEVPSTWPRAHVGDLWLACACAAADAPALGEFERRYGNVVDQVTARFRLGDARASEVRQLLRERLLVSDPGKPPRIAGYSGRGELAGWVRAAATRVALNLIRDEDAPPAGDLLLDRLPAAGDDPELALLKARYAGPFREAFAGALASLPAPARLLLKQHYVDGLTGEDLGQLHRVHRKTVLRWIAEARQQVVVEAERRITEVVGVPQNDLASLLRLVRSRLDLSVHDLLDATSE